MTVHHVTEKPDIMCNFLLSMCTLCELFTICAHGTEAVVGAETNGLDTG